MSEKRMFIIPEGLMERIEKHRGEMSRSEFVDYCVDSVLKGQTGDRGGQAPPRESKRDSSLGQLKRQVIRTLDNAHLLNSSGLTEAPAQAVAVSSQPIASGIAANEVVAESDVKLEQVKVEEKKESMWGSMPFSWLWIPALLLFGFGDTLTSYLVFANGGQEANPFMSMAMQLAGGGMMGFVAIKAVIMVSLVLLSWFWLKKHSWVVPAALSVVGGYLVGHNIVTLMGIM